MHVILRLDDRDDFRHVAKAISNQIEYLRAHYSLDTRGIAPLREVLAQVVEQAELTEKEKG